MNKLPEDFKAKWVAALRSGEYSQCKGRLHDLGGHCCLGVAEIISGLTSSSSYILKNNSRNGDKKFPFVIEGDSKAAEILTDMNDAGKSFSEIADWIETNL